MWSLDHQHLQHLEAHEKYRITDPIPEPVNRQLWMWGPRISVLTNLLGPSCTFKREKLCSKTPGHSGSYWAGHNCVVSSSLSSVPLLSRSFSSGIQKGKVWHLLGTSVTHGEISTVTNPGTVPSWKSRGLFFFFSFFLPCFPCLRREVLETQSRLTKMHRRHRFGLGLDYLKLNLPLNLVKVPFEEGKSQSAKLRTTLSL